MRPKAAATALAPSSIGPSLAVPVVGSPRDDDRSTRLVSPAFSIENRQANARGSKIVYANFSAGEGREVSLTLTGIAIRYVVLLSVKNYPIKQPPP